MDQNTNMDKKSALQNLLQLFDWHTKIYKNAIDGISEEDARQRLNTKANHVGWLAGSLVQERFLLRNLLGGDEKQTSDDLFKNHQGIKDDVQYPSLDEYRADWDRISPILRQTLEGLSSDQLEGPDPFEMPGGNYTLFDSLTFMTDRESYVIGQIALWRRLLGYDAMKYD